MAARGTLLLRCDRPQLGARPFAPTTAPPPLVPTSPRVVPPLFPECVGDTPSSQRALRQSTGASASFLRAADSFHEGAGHTADVIGG